MHSNKERSKVDDQKQKIISFHKLHSSNNISWKDAASAVAAVSFRPGDFAFVSDPTDVVFDRRKLFYVWRLYNFKNFY